MKKYVRPVTELVRAEALSFVCESGKRVGDWGNDGSDPYGNGDLHNEGYNSSGEPIEDDNGSIDAQSKEQNLWW